MATGLSASIGATIVNALLNGATYTGTATLYGKLHTGDPGSAGTSNAAPETDRQLVEFNSTFGTANPNVNTVTWTAVAGTGLQTFTAMSFWSASSGGTFQFSIPFSGTVTAGNDFEIAPGGIVINLLGIGGMSATPYRVQDLVGADPFTGTGAQTILDTPFADIPDDAEAGDRFYFETSVALQKTSGTSYSVVQKLLLDGVDSHSETIAFIGIHADARFLVCRYALTILDASSCYITADVTLSGTGGFGPNPQYRSNPATPNPAFNVGSAVAIDFTVQLSSAAATCTPQLVDGWKVLNLGGSVSVGAVASVNGVAPDLAGNVQINYSHVGALALEWLPLPLVQYDAVNGYYGQRNLGSSPEYPHLYYGTPNPTDPAEINPVEPFVAGTDIWLAKG